MAMDAELWKRVDELFQTVLPLRADDRVAYLESAASGDSLLRREVESLLRCAAGSFLESSPLGSGLPDAKGPTAPIFNRGNKIRDFEIVELLGRGGMGEVYRVRDTRLNREVALKVLPSGQDQRRFEREAHALATLKHPNVVTVYEFGNENGIWFLAEELIEGGSLEELLRKRRLPIEQCLRLAVEIASGLAAAHRSGIVHRDLKPGNVMLTVEKTARIVDFGLSRATSRAEEPPDAVTAIGMIAGTAAYMSPEQAEGKSADTRADIFSYGSVLYEMLTGRRAFKAHSPTATLVAVLHDEPAGMAEIVPGISRELIRIVGRCLRKDPAKRYQVIEDVKLALEEVQGQAGLDDERSQPVPARQHFSWMALVGTLIAASALVAVLWFVRQRGRSDEGPTLTRVTTDSGLATDPALSPDGKLLAYASNKAGSTGLDLWVRQPAGGAPVQLTPDGLDNREPSFSPDGSMIVFQSARGGGGIYVVPALGGEPRQIAGAGRRPRFSPDGRWVAYWSGTDITTGPRDAQQLLIVPAKGGAARIMSPGFVEARSPVWSPDGKHILFIGRKGTDEFVRDLAADWWIVPVSGAPPVALHLASALRYCYPDPLAWMSGRGIIFTADSGDVRNIWRVSATAAGSRLLGTPQRLTIAGGKQTSASWSGSLMAFAVERVAIDLYSFSVATNSGRVGGAKERLTQDAGSNIYPSLDATGTRMVFSSDRQGTMQVWFKNLRTGREIPFFGSSGNLAFLSPDGSTAMYSNQERDRTTTFLLDIARDDTLGVPRQICTDCENMWTASADAKTILFSTNYEQREVYALDVDSGRRTKVLAAATPIIGRPRFSPDKKWLVFNRWRGAEFRLFVARYDGTVQREGDWTPITDGSFADRIAYWSPNGEWLYFFSNRDGHTCIWAQRVNRASKHPIGKPVAVLHFHSARQTLGSIPFIRLGMGLTDKQIVVNTGETRGEIWMANYKGKEF